MFLLGISINRVGFLPAHAKAIFLKTAAFSLRRRQLLSAHTQYHPLSVLPRIDMVHCREKLNTWYRLYRRKADIDVFFASWHRLGTEVLVQPYWIEKVGSVILSHVIKLNWLLL